MALPNRYAYYVIMLYGVMSHKGSVGSHSLHRGTVRNKGRALEYYFRRTN